MHLKSICDRHLESVNFDPNSHKFLACIGVFNGALWLEYCIKSIYEKVDKILIVEGAVINRSDSIHSTDGTLEIIEKYPDVANKIELITIDRYWASLEEQKQTFLDKIEQISRQENNPNARYWMLIVDHDEIYRPGDIDRLRKAIELRPWASEFIPTFLHFYKDFTHIRHPSPSWNILHQRFFRWQSGMKYRTHPVATDSDGVDTCLSPQYQPFRFAIPFLYVFHYGMITTKQEYEKKIRFYDKELAKFGASEEHRRKLEEFINDSEPDDSILEYDGPHPKVMLEHPLYNYKYELFGNSKQFANWQSIEEYTTRSMCNIYSWDFGRSRDMQFINILEV